MNRRQGVTLIELLVAGFIAVLVTYLAYELIQGEHGHYTRTRTKVRLQSDGREAIRAIEEDLLNAGFRMGLDVSTGGATKYYAKQGPCGNMTADDRVRVRDDHGTGSDTLDIQYFDHSAAGVSCPPVATPTPNFIRYYVKNGQLVRELTPAGSAAMTSSTVLDSVVALQFQVGLDSTASGRPTKGVDDTLWMRAHADLANWQCDAGSLVLKENPNPLADSSLEMAASNWKQAVLGTISLNKTKTLQPLSIYRMTAEIRTNSDFRLMYGNSNRSYIRLRVAAGATVVDTLTIAVPSFDGPTRFAWQFQTGNSQIPLVAPQFDIYLAEPLTGTPDFAITKFQVTRVRNAGQNGGSASYVWENGDGSARQSRSALAVQVWLLSKSAHANKENDQPTFTGIGNWSPAGFTPGTTDHNSYLVYHRIVPVGNYGN